MAADVVALIRTLQARGIELRAEGDALKLNAPRGAMDADLAAQVRAQKPELLAFLHQAAGAGAGAAAIERVDDAAPILMSRPQERLWTVAQLHDEGALYHVPGAWRLSGDVHIDAVRASLRAFLDHHEVFQYRFHERDGAPMIHLSSDVSGVLLEVDISDTPEEDRPNVLHAHMDREVDRPFDLANAPAVRIFLYVESPSSIVVLVVAHALIWDGWSFDIFLAEVAERYAAAVEARDPVLPEAPVRFRDYAAWAREREQSPAIEEKRRWWHEQLEGTLPPLALPHDDAGMLVHERHGGRAHLDIGQELSEQVRELARSLGVTVPMLLLSAYIVVLARYGAADEVLVTVPVRGRDHVEFEGVIGVFTNSIFVRIRVDDDPTFADLARRTRDVVLEAMDHDDVPVDRIVEGLGHAGAADGSGLFQVSFSYQQTESRPRSMGSVALTAVDLTVRDAHMDLMLWFRDYAPRLNGGVDYRADRFDAATIARFREHLTTTLRQAVASSDQALSHFSVLGEDEARAVDGWFDAAVTEGAGATKDGPVAANAGPGPGAPSAAGWLSAIHPAARLAVGGDQVDRAGLRAMVTEAKRSRAGDSGVASLSGSPHTLGALAELLGRLGSGGASDTAFVTYEEADLLAPTGLPVTVASLASAANAFPTLDATDRVLVLTSLATARAVAELFAALGAGAEVVVPTADERASDWALRDLTDALRPTALFGPAPLLRALAASSASAESLRLVVVSGPGAGASLAAALAAWAPQAERFLIWGPTSAAGVATKRTLDPAAEAGALGAPLRGRRVRVFGPHGELLPLGVRGQVHVAVGGGPFEPSGTHAVWRSVGTLVSAGVSAGTGEGRVTIDGITADPSVLTREIAALPGVREAFVGAAEPAPGEPVIVAWVALEPGVEVVPHTLRVAFAGRVPDAFLPAFVAEVAEIPRDSSGAVSLSALPLPFARPGEGDGEALRPGLEAVVAAIYAELLGLRRVGPHDGFIELGGNSLLALRALTEIERRIGWRPSPRVLFFQTVRQLAHRAETEGAHAEAAS